MVTVTDDERRRVFGDVMRAALDGVAANAATGEQLMPVIFLISTELEVSVVGWSVEEQPRNSVGMLRDVARARYAVAAVSVSEATTSDGEGLGDAVIVHGTFPSLDDTRLVTFELVDRRLIPSGMTVPLKLVDWLRQILEYEGAS